MMSHCIPQNVAKTGNDQYCNSTLVEQKSLKITPFHTLIYLSHDLLCSCENEQAKCDIA